MEQNRPYQNRGNGGGNQSPEYDFNKPFVAKWKEEKPERDISFDENWIIYKIELDAVRYADKFGELLSRKLTTSQLRNFFGEVRRIQMQHELNTTDLFLLKPKLAYAARRQNGEGVRLLKLVLDSALNVVCEADESVIKERFERFVSFFEAILAYHKGHGGKDTGR